MNQPLTERQIQAILARAAPDTETASDVEALDGEITRLADQLSDCWLFLDKLARVQGDRAMQVVSKGAERLLRKQKAPGWKD